MHKHTHRNTHVHDAASPTDPPPLSWHSWAETVPAVPKAASESSQTCVINDYFVEMDTSRLKASQSKEESFP